MMRGILIRFYAQAALKCLQKVIERVEGGRFPVEKAKALRNVARKLLLQAEGDRKSGDIVMGGTEESHTPPSC